MIFILGHGCKSLVIRRELDYLDLSKNRLASVEGLASLENVTFVNLGE